MEQLDVERIARATLKDLGVSPARFTIEPPRSHAGQWHIAITGTRPASLTIRCGTGSTAHWVRAQIVDQYFAQS